MSGSNNTAQGQSSAGANDPGNTVLLTKTTPTNVGVVPLNGDNRVNVYIADKQVDIGRKNFPTGKSLLLSVKSFAFLLETFLFYPSNFFCPELSEKSTGHIGAIARWGSPDLTGKCYI